MKQIDTFYEDDIKIDESGNKQYVSHTSLKKNECYALYNVVSRYLPKKTLEVGFALGASSIAIMAAKADQNIVEKHIVLDPFQSKLSFNVGLINVEKAGFSNRLTLHEEFSENYLNMLYNRNEKIDFIFIDGNHSLGQAVTDAFLSDKVLSKKGIIGIHDSLLFSTAASIRYLIQDHGYKLISRPEINLKNIARRIKYLNTLGRWYCKTVIPYINGSIIFLQKP